MFEGPAIRSQFKKKKKSYIYYNRSLKKLSQNGQRKTVKKDKEQHEKRIGARVLSFYQKAMEKIKYQIQNLINIQ